MSLGQLALTGFTWNFISNISTKIIGLITSVILARLLDPEDFGLVAMLYVFFEVSNVIVNGGFSQALIREDTMTERDKSTVFSINVILGLFLYFILWWSSPLIADFYDISELKNLTRFMGLTIIIRSISVVQNTSLIHQLNFKTLFLINIISSIVAGIVGIFLAFSGYGVWALAINYVLFSLLFNLLIFQMFPWIPRFFIVKDSFRRLFSFGSKIFLSGLLNTFYGNIYKLVIGKYFNAATLGFFTQAQVFVSQVTQGAMGTIQNVTYPLLSKTKSDPKNLKSVYRKIIMASSYLIFPMIIGLGLVAEPLVLTLIGEAWKRSVPILQILCLAGALFHLHSINLNVLKVVGRSDLFLKLEVIKKLNITLAIVIGLQYGLWGLLIAHVFTSYIALFVNIYYTKRFINYSYKEQFRDLYPILLHTGPMILGVWTFMKFTTLASYITLLGAICIGVVLYFTTTVLLRSSALREILILLSGRFPLFKKFHL